MRRIIERVVTVVTTTTWKISWETDVPHDDTNSVSSELPGPEGLSEVVQDSQTRAPAIKTKEVEPHEKEEKTTDQIAEEPLHEAYPYPSKIERKSKP